MAALAGLLLSSFPFLPVSFSRCLVLFCFQLLLMFHFLILLQLLQHAPVLLLWHLLSELNRRTLLTSLSILSFGSDRGELLLLVSELPFESLSCGC